MWGFFFGLLAEYMGLNATETPASTTDLGISVHRPKTPSEIESIYNKLVLRERDGSLVRITYNDLNMLTGIAKELVPTDVPLKLRRHEHFLRCLGTVYDIFSGLRNYFDHNIKSSISSLYEVLFDSWDLMFGEISPRRSIWQPQGGYLTPDIKSSMVANGWCPSDIFRAEAKYRHAQTLYMLRMMGRLPEEKHNQCSEYECKLFQIVDGQYNVGHLEIGCPCKLLSVSYERLLCILDGGDAFPLLKCTGGLEDLRVELVSSATRTPYVAISHVGLLTDILTELINPGLGRRAWESGQQFSLQLQNNAYT